MSMNSGGGGRAGRGPVRSKETKKPRSKVKTYDQHKYDGSDPDMEPMEA
jgi:hypothetical protein